MEKRLVVFQAFFTIIASLFGWTPTAKAQCPNTEAHETALDCPWADVTRATLGLSDANQIRSILDQKIPGFVAQLKKDAKDRDLLDLWSLSRNIDESNLKTGTLTVPANLLAFFNSILKVPYNTEFTEGHAGLTHTYGYLFSNTWTPFGYKRLRYVAGESEQGLGLPDGVFSGRYPTGTLLSNLTAFVAPIAFRDHPSAWTPSEAIPEIAAYPFSTLKVKRLVERVENKKFVLEMRTDIVNFVYPNTHGKNQALLIYSIDFHAPSQISRPRLVTVFPVEASFATGLFNPATLGNSTALKLKYNAVLPVSIPAEEMVGKRFILNESPSN